MSVLLMKKTVGFLKEEPNNLSLKDENCYSLVDNLSLSKEDEEFQEIFLNIMSHQSKTENYIENQKTMFLFRGHLLGWLHTLNVKLEYCPQTIFRAIVILDKFLEKNNNKIEKGKIQLYAAVCYFIAIKLEEVNCISLEFLRREILKGKFTRELILQTEYEILKLLNFKLQFPTIQNFFDLYVQNLKISESFIFVFNQMSYFVNMMSQFVDELIFETDPSKLSMINLRTTFLILDEIDTFRTIEKENYRLNMNFYSLILKYGKEEHNEILKISMQLNEAILGQKENNKLKVFFEIYQNCLNQCCNNKSN